MIVSIKKPFLAKLSTWVLQAEKVEADKKAVQLQEQITQLLEESRIAASEAAAALEEATTKGQEEIQTLKVAFHQLLLNSCTLMQMLHMY